LIRPGPRNALTDVAGLKVGTADDARARTGVTVILPDEPALACVDVRGGSPGTVNASALGPAMVNRNVDGIVLSGGSAFGLASVTAVACWLAGRGRGRKQGAWPVPLVAGVNIGDLGNGGDKGWDCASPPYATLAKRPQRPPRPRSARATPASAWAPSPARSRAGRGPPPRSTPRPGRRWPPWSP
jgi:L-aminopeptidase/D-esterase-like protein